MRNFFFIVLLLSSFFMHAQDGSAERKWMHTLNVQVNPLLRQLLTIGQVEADNTPFLLNYHINSVKSGWGLRTGFGLNYVQLKDNDGITSRNSGLTEYAVRLGFERRHALGKRWEGGYGLDGVMLRDENSTRTVVTSFDTVTTESNSNITRLGGGLMLWLRFKVSEHVLIGTESSLYYQTGTLKEDVTITRKDFTQPGAPKTTVQNKFSTTLTELPFRVPVSLYINIRF